jgi:hypothetical protein
MPVVHAHARSAARALRLPPSALPWGEVLVLGTIVYVLVTLR